MAGNFAAFPSWMGSDDNDAEQQNSAMSEEFQRDIQFLSPCPTLVLQ